MIKVYSSFAEIETLWESLESGDSCEPFHTLAWAKQTARCEAVGKLLLLAVDECCIFPLEVNAKAKTITFLGQEGSSDYLQPVYSQWQDDYLAQCGAYLSEHYSGYRWLCDRIKDDSPCLAAFEALAGSGQWEKTVDDCVSVYFDGEKPFYDSLSKHTRQNYRTAKNRLCKQNLTPDIRYQEGTISKAEAEELFSLYVQRRDDVYAESGAGLRYFAHKVLRTILPLKAEKDTLSSYAMENPVCLGRIYLNGVLAAYFMGLKLENRIFVCRVATHKDFYAYSPGVILFTEVCENLRREYTELDLTRGNESYKFQLGGVLRQNANFRTVLK